MAAASASSGGNARQEQANAGDARASRAMTLIEVSDFRRPVAIIDGMAQTPECVDRFDRARNAAFPAVHTI
jgi:hypothetical protein